MSAFNSSEHPSTIEASEDTAIETRGPEGESRVALGTARNRWIAVGGIFLLLLGLGFGWRWLQSPATGQSGAAAGAAAGPRSFPVKLETTTTSTVKEYSEFVGSLESRRSVVLKPEITGRISEILVKAGDLVTEGTPLVQLQPDKQNAEFASVLASVNSARASRTNALSQLQALQADRASNAAEVDLQNDEYRRIAALVKEGALPQQQLDQVVRDRRRAVAQLNAIDQRIKAAQAGLGEAEAGVQQAQANANLANAQLQDARIVAPFSGTVGDIPVRLGQLVGKDDALTTITQNESLDLRLSIPLERGPELHQGQRVELTDAQGKVLSVGRVSFISPQVDSRAQSILAKATFDNPDGRLRDGQFVRARVIWKERPGILIPTAAISRLGGETFVFVAQPPDPASAHQDANKSEEKAGAGGNQPTLVAKQKPVKLGNIQGNQYQVLEGLRPGEQIVVSGILNLADGVPIKPEQSKPGS